MAEGKGRLSSFTRSRPLFRIRERPEVRQKSQKIYERSQLIMHLTGSQFTLDMLSLYGMEKGL
jgi:hypothetical protein